MSDYTFLSPTIVDRFVQIPDTLQVDARDNVITVQEDTLLNYDHYFRFNDFAIFCDIKKTTFFNSGMDWKYRMADELNKAEAYNYYRIIASKVVWGDRWSVREVRFNGFQPATTDVTSSPGVAVVANAVDGNTSTLYSSSDTYRYMCEYGSYVSPGVNGFEPEKCTFDVSGVGYSGEYLQIGLPGAVSIGSYSLTTPADMLGAPVDWVVLGSTNGTTWSLVDKRAGVVPKARSTAYTYTLAAASPAFSFYRLVANGRLLYGTGLAVPEWKLLMAGTGAAVPPAPLTANSTTLSGYGAPLDGAYTASGSSMINASTYAYLAFDGSANTSWQCVNYMYSKNAQPGYNMIDAWVDVWAPYSALSYPSPQVMPMYTQDMYMNVYKGDWIQVKMPTPSALTSYSFYPEPATNFKAGLQSASTFYVLGSFDGQAWKLVDSQVNLTEADYPRSVYKVFTPKYGQYAGVKLLDAHDPLAQIPVSLTQPILSVAATKAHLGSVTDQTRFVHYKQAGRFFKYSFKVGDAVSIPVLDSSGSPVLDPSSNQVTRRGQLYGVYLDAQYGMPLPYWITVSGAGADQTAETRAYFYADSTVLGGAATLTAVAAGANSLLAASGLLSSLDGGAAVSVSVVAPPDPEFIENRTDASGGCKGGSLVLNKDASGNLAIRPVGERDASGNGLVNYTQSNFRLFTTDPSRALVMYWVVNPPARGTADAVYPSYMGEELFVAWASKALSTAAGGWRPMRDFFNKMTGQYETSVPGIGQLQGASLEKWKFVANRDVAAGAVGAVRDSVRSGFSGLNLSGAAAKLDLPISQYAVNHLKPNESDVTTSDFFVPLAYSVLNKTDFGFDKNKSILGGRIMQLVCHYLFDGATNRELAYFPYLLNEAKSLTDKIIDALAALLGDVTTAASGTRSDILRQMEIKYGRRYFDEYATLNQVTNERIGNVWAVLQKIDELYLFFTVTVRTTVSLRSKDKVDVLRFVEIPVVIRASD